MVQIKDITIASTITNDDFSIPIKIYQPSANKQQQPRAAVFFIHGGIFALNDASSHPTIATALCELCGLVVVTASFRCGAMAPHGSGVTMRDLRDVVEFVRGGGGGMWEGGADVPFGLVGSSSVGSSLRCNSIVFQHMYFSPLCLLILHVSTLMKCDNLQTNNSNKTRADSLQWP
jgi:hypothetical protein